MIREINDMSSVMTISLAFMVNEREKEKMAIELNVEDFYVNFVVWFSFELKHFHKTNSSLNFRINFFKRKAEKLVVKSIYLSFSDHRKTVRH